MASDGTAANSETAGEDVDGGDEGEDGDDGVSIPGLDFAAIDAGYSASQIGPPIIPGAPAGGVTAVPEPASLGLFGLAAMGLIQDVLRLPLVPLSESRRGPLYQALKAAGVNLPGCGKVVRFGS